MTFTLVDFGCFRCVNAILITIRLPRWLIDKLRADGDIGRSIENALTEHILAEATPRETSRKVELIKKAVLEEIVIEES